MLISRGELESLHHGGPETLDMKRVLGGRPWSFDRYLLYLSSFNYKLAPQNLEFKRDFFWVQFHNLPFGMMNCTYGEMLGEIIGEVDDDQDGIGWGSFLRVRTWIDITNLLLRGN